MILVGVCGGVWAGLLHDTGFFRGGGAFARCIPRPWVVCRGEPRPSIPRRVLGAGVDSGAAWCFKVVLSKSDCLSLGSASCSFGGSPRRLTANINFF